MPFCPNCGANVDSAHQYCHSCGGRLDTKSAAEPQPVQSTKEPVGRTSGETIKKHQRVLFDWRHFRFLVTSGEIEGKPLWSGKFLFGVLFVILEVVAGVGGLGQYQRWGRYYTTWWDNMPLLGLFLVVSACLLLLATSRFRWQTRVTITVISIAIFCLTALSVKYATT